jgi:phage terminase large subunit
MPVFWANFLAKESIVVNQGGTSSTKSQSLIRVMFTCCAITPNIKAEVAAISNPKLVADCLEIAEGIYKNNPAVRSLIKQYHQTKSTFFFHNGSKLVLRAYENADDAQGPRRHILYISEARNFTWSTAEQLILRTKYRTFIDYNPVEQFWVHDKLINCPIGPNGKKEYPSVKVIRSWHIHNNFLTQAQHDKIENIADKELWKAYARGLTATVSGMVYPGWQEIESFPECKQIVWGMDIGFTNDPTVLVKVGIGPIGLPYDYVFEEICYAPGIASGHIRDLLIEYGYKFGQPVYMDHVNSIQRELRSLRIVAVKANKGPGCIEARVLHLRSNRCAYTKKSVNLKEEKSRYMFFQDKDGLIKNKPKEGNDHAMNACEYGAFSHAIRTGLIKGFVNEPDSY